MKRSNVKKNILMFSLPIIFLCLCLFLCPANAQLTPEQAQELAYIRAAIKAKGAKWTAKETSISRLPKEKRRQLCGLKFSNAPDTGAIGNSGPVASTQTESFPPSLDWRDNGVVTPIKDQGYCGSCWAFAAVGAFESVLLINGNSAGKSRSEQYMISCSSDNLGCCGGYLDKAYNFLLNYGVPSGECSPYTSDGAMKQRGPVCFDRSDSCPSTCTDGSQLDIEVISGWNFVSNTITHIMEALQSGPVSAGMYVYTDFYSYGGGVYEYTSGGLEGGHAIVIVGYGTTVDNIGYWICKNSWGTGWGEGYGEDNGGYFRIRQNDAVYPADPVDIGREAALFTYQSIIECSSNETCNDSNPCTNDTCVNAGTVYSYCENNPVMNGTLCTDGHICCAGVCSTPACSEYVECDDGESCTIDTCVNSEMCSATCNNTWPDCGLEDGCCGPECTSSNDSDCQITCIPHGEPCSATIPCCAGKCHPKKGYCL